MGDDPADSARILSDYLQALDVQSGEARNRAQRDYEAARQKKEAASKYASVWRKLLSDPESLLLDLFREEVEQATAVRPDRAGAAEFIRAQAPIATELPARPTAARGAQGKPAQVTRTKQMSASQLMRYRFFEGLLEHAKSRTLLHANISPSKDTWVAAGAGKTGLTFVYVVAMRGARVELYIDSEDGDKNQQYFEALFLRKDMIEAAFGSPLDWQPLEGRRACRIKKTYATGGYRDEDVWDAVYEELAVAMAKLETALRPHLKRL